MRSIGLTIARNSLFTIGSQIALRCLSVIFSIMIVRQLGDHDFGVYATVGALVGITAIFSDLGMAGYGVRRIAEDHTQAAALLANMVPPRLLLALCLLGVNVCLAHVLDYPNETIVLVAIGGLGLLLYACQGPLEVVLLGFERLDYSAAFNVMNQAVFIASGAVFLWLGWGVRGVIIASFCGVAAALLATLRIVRQLITFSWRINVKSWPLLLRAGIPFCLSTFAMTVSFKVDTILLSLWRMPMEVGWYNVAYNLVLSLQSLASGFISVLMPSLSRHHRHDPAGTVQFYLQSQRFLLLLGLPIAVGGSLLANRLLLLVYGTPFVPAGSSLRILFWVLPILMITSLYGSLMTVMHREGTMARVNIVNATFSLAANLWVIPRYGMIGAAYMTVITELIGWVQFSVVLRDKIHPRIVLGTLVRPFIAAIAMGAAVTLLWSWTLVALLPIAISIYAIVLLLIGGVTMPELRHLASACGASLRRQAKSMDLVAEAKEVA